MENELPKGWVLSQLKDVGDVVTGNTPPKKDIQHFGGNIPWIKPGDLLDRKIMKFEETLTESGASIARLLPPNSVMVSCIGNLGKIGIIDRPATTNQQINSVVFNDSIVNPIFGFYYALTLKEWLYENSSATTVSIINKGRFEKAPIPVPPLPEQQRIVAKLDTLFGHLDALKTRLDRIPQLLKDFRQKVLTQAVTGKLTETLTKWEKTNLGNLVFKGGIFDGPFGSNLKTEDYKSDGVRVIRLENIEFLNFVEDKETFVSEEKYNTLTRHTVGAGDIIFSSFISEDIRACILPELKTKAIAKADCFCIRPNETIIDKKYLLFLLVSKISFNQLVANIHGATRPRINTTQLKTLVVSLPPLEEQQEIVRRVESLFAKADHIEASYQKLKAKIEQLPQALLAKAFRGELVEQLPTDGDARDLLEQIKRVKEGLEKGGKGRKMNGEDEVRMVADRAAKYGKK